MSQDKPCRTCTDFKTWAKKQKQTYDNEQESKKKQDSTSPECKTRPPPEPPRRTDCPLDKDELGSRTWGLLHTMAAYYPEKPDAQQKSDMNTFIHTFSKFYPCSTCAEDLREQLKLTPPQTDSQKSLSQWFCRIHNEVNKKVGKPEFDCKLVDDRWKNGWKDGSCD